MRAERGREGERERGRDSKSGQGEKRRAAEKKKKKKQRSGAAQEFPLSWKRYNDNHLITVCECFVSSRIVSSSPVQSEVCLGQLGILVQAGRTRSLSPKAPWMTNLPTYRLAISTINPTMMPVQLGATDREIQWAAYITYISLVVRMAATGWLSQRVSNTVSNTGPGT